MAQQSEKNTIMLKPTGKKLDYENKFKRILKPFDNKMNHLIPVQLFSSRQEFCSGMNLEMNWALCLPH